MEKAAALPAETKPAQAAERAELEVPSFAGMNDWQKLEEPHRLHKETDYSGMTDAENYRTVYSRLEAAFPDYQAIFDGAFGCACVLSYGQYGPDDYMQKTLPQKIYAEIYRQKIESGIREQESEYSPGRLVNDNLHREAFYNSMSDREIVWSICEKFHYGTDAINRISLVKELDSAGLRNSECVKNDPFLQRIYQMYCNEANQ